MNNLIENTVYFRSTSKPLYQENFQRTKDKFQLPRTEGAKLKANFKQKKTVCSE